MSRNDTANYTFIYNQSEFRIVSGDATPPTITFEIPPTPVNASSNSTNPVTIVANISDASNTSAFIDFDRTLVGYWSMDYYNSTGIFDNSTWNNFGTFAAGTGLNYSNLTTGKRGQALKFDGVNDYVDITDMNITTQNNNFTVALWHKINQKDTYDVLIGDYDSAAGDEGWVIEFQGANYPYFTAGTTCGIKSVVGSTSSVVDGVWHFTTIVVNTTNVFWFQDGVTTLASFGGVCPINDSHYTMKLSRGSGDYNYINSSFDEVMVFNRSLSQTEISALYSSQINKFNTSSMNLSYGQHNYTVYAIDEYGNAANSGFRNFTVSAGDITPPTITFETPPTPFNNSITKTPVTIVANISDASNTSAWMDFNRSLKEYWAMDYYNTTGIYDNSTWNNFGAFSGGLSTSNIGTGKRGKALTFDGVDDRIIASNLSLNDTDKISVSFWIKFTSSILEVIGEQSSDYGSNNAFIIDINDLGGIGHITVAEHAAIGFNAVYTSNTYNDGNWHHVVSIMNRTAGSVAITIYVDGVNDTTYDPSYVADNNENFAAYPFYLGGRSSTSTYNFTGSLDEFMIFGRALSLTEVKALYSSQINKFNTSTMNLPNGQDNYTVYAIDEYGNAANSGFRNFTVDAIAPTITFEEPPTPLNSSIVNSITQTIVANISDLYDTSSWMDFDRSLVGYWAMDYYNATVIYDNSTFKYNATFQGGLNYSNLTAGARGQGITIDGSDDYLTPGQIGNFDGNFTVSIWVKSGQYSSGSGIFTRTDAGSYWYAKGFSITELSSPETVYLAINDGDGHHLEHQLIAASTFGWTSIIITRAGNTLTSYMNGNSLGSDSLAGFTSINGSQNLNFGVGNGAFFNGSLDEIMMFQRALSPTEVLALYNSKSNKFNSSITNLADGQHNYTVYAVDEAGNTNNSGQRNFIVDTVAPTITFEVPPTPTNASTILSFVTIVANISDLYNTSSFIDLDRSLVGYWSMDYYNTTGIFDNSTYKNNGSFNGGLSTSNIVAGMRGQALTFDGSDDYVTLNSVTPSGNKTISVWVKPYSTGTGSQRAILGNYIAQVNSGGTLSHYNDITYLSSSFGLNYGEWSHAVFVLDESTNSITFYINGVFAGTQSSPKFSSTTNIIGAYAAGPDFDFNGSMDELMIFNRPLSATEVKALYDSKNNKFNTSTMNLSNGQHNYTVYAIDQAGNTNNSGQRNFIVDILPPTITFEEPPTPINASSNSSSPATIVANISDASNTSAWIDFDRTLVGYWAMDYYNATGIFDNSTYKYNGTFYGGLGTDDLITGARGKALNFDGSDDYINTSSNLNPGASNFSISVWFRANSTSAQIIYNKEDLYEASAGGGYFTYAWQPHWAWDGGTSFSVNSGEWYNAVIVYNGTQQAVYKNGLRVYIRDQTGSIGSSSSVFMIGDRGMRGSPFIGDIDELIIFNRSLSQAEINALYSSQINKFNTSAMPLGNEQHNYTVYAIDQLGNVANSGLRWFILGGTCVYSSGNWNINCSQYCNITSNADVGNNNITISGVGTVTVSANVSNYMNLHINGENSVNICRVRCINGGCFKN
jgi:hypothetical protein